MINNFINFYLKTTLVPPFGVRRSKKKIIISSFAKHCQNREDEFFLDQLYIVSVNVYTCTSSVRVELGLSC